jgi:hypothetical protein
MSIKQSDYLESPNHCPNPECGCDDIETTGRPQADEGHMWQDVTCSNCGWAWTDVHKLVGLTNVTDMDCKKVEVDES